VLPVHLASGANLITLSTLRSPGYIRGPPRRRGVQV
jgi:hypothetical protein